MQDTWQWPKARRYHISAEFACDLAPSDFVGAVEGYCRNNGFKIVDTTAERIMATRGSLWGNCNSFNTQKIICSGEFELVSGHFRATLRPDGIMQQITGWNFASYQLELLELKGNLLGLQKPLWLRQFRFENGLAAFLYFVTLGLACHKLPRKWELKIQEYCSGEPAPKVLGPDAAPISLREIKPRMSAFVLQLVLLAFGFLSVASCEHYLREDAKPLLLADQQPGRK